MIRKNWLTRGLFFTAAVIFLLQTTACGTILHPERKGQKTGKIDPGIAILDGLGLLLFVIPGVIAFAVDFTNGTIYLPGGRNSLLDDENTPKPLRAIRLPEEKVSKDLITAVVRDATGTPFDMNTDNLHVYKVAGINEIMLTYKAVIASN